MRLTLVLLTMVSLSGCYAMPGENDYSVIPATNNPAVTREKPGSILPGVGY